MKFRGNALNIREVVEVVIPRSTSNITFKVSAIPMGLHRDYETIVPRPIPPFEMRHRAGSAPEKVENYDDPKFIEQFAQYVHLRNIFTVYTVLKADEGIEFSTVPTNAASLQAIEAELKDAGFSDGDLNIILATASEASNISDTDIRAAKKSF